MVAKLKAIKAELQHRMHNRMAEVGAWLRKARVGLLPTPRCPRERDSVAHLPTSRVQAMAECSSPPHMGSSPKTLRRYQTRTGSPSSQRTNSSYELRFTGSPRTHFLIKFLRSKPLSRAHLFMPIFVMYVAQLVRKLPKGTNPYHLPEAS